MKIFISYRRDDTIDVVGRIRDRLAREFSADDIYMDIDSIPIGVDFRQHIDSAVRQCDVLLAVIGRDWVSATDSHGARRLDEESDFVRLELLAALDRGIPVVPVLVRDASMPAEVDLPGPLAGLAFRQAIVVRRDPDFHSDMLRLTAGIRSHQPRPTRPASPPAPSRMAAAPVPAPAPEQAKRVPAVAAATVAGARRPSDLDRSKRTERRALAIGVALVAVVVALALVVSSRLGESGGEPGTTVESVGPIVSLGQPTAAPTPPTSAVLTNSPTAAPVQTSVPQGVTDFDCNQWYVQIGSRVTSDPEAPGSQDRSIRALFAASGWTPVLVDSRRVDCTGLGVGDDGERWYWFVGPLPNSDVARSECGAVRSFQAANSVAASQLALVRNPQDTSTSACG
jgi:hypothetical protein